MGLVAEWWDYFVYLSKTVAQELGLAVCPWSPIAGGFLAGKYRREGNSGAVRGGYSKPKIIRCWEKFSGATKIGAS